MNTIKTLSCLLIVTLLCSCSQEKKDTIITVKNTLNFERTFETVEIQRTALSTENLSSIGIKNTTTGKLLVTQLVDTDGDGAMDQLLFQPKIAANSEVNFEVVTISDAEKPKAEELCYSRFVPERTDDYTWENDKVAFRVYGPVAQKMVEENVPGGTLSSGVDAWLKKVKYPIINKWYKETIIDKTGSYHEDTGEGLDDFHVGSSRGIGGIAVKIDSTYFLSKNYTKWKTITTGPIRTSFYLEYANWDASGKIIKESKTISLDLGSNLSKFSTSIEGVDQISAGLTLHKKDGEVSGNKDEGWVSYWQPHADSELGSAIIADRNTFSGFEKYDIDTPDLSNAYAHLKVKNNKVVYYAGFGWKKSNQFKTRQAWEAYLKIFSKKINNPLEVRIK
ncbi:DUF4861 domain-containing protein [Polaribacter sejongensis]|uniref:DUF4861 domain-containing protein n=2 Tax=Polaribacter sejongensis TaxID=985043 RepID=A0AAJ1QWU6_9FLAO|nr:MULTISPECIES: DUF4861 domain-containing protein [Polaribacter]AUC23492.1 DUF4861 domain-containing protein [Polaribacter sejongensis]MDN3619585.1 DUF4861 domain-containing protein [Polaribacter undariae]UWD32301.1 DUF4861 domain-containing protein [Polaribacter undariae]